MSSVHLRRNFFSAFTLVMSSVRLYPQCLTMFSVLLYLQCLRFIYARNVFGVCIPQCLRCIYTRNVFGAFIPTVFIAFIPAMSPVLLHPRRGITEAEIRVTSALLEVPSD